ncbi:PASTA domain-containing protein [Blattabacterium cuenoti]|uniref:PASTA domain-containing protein n=1 Tax=Blattabacterium cuenoti STAT TaxID=1457030 RepID=A0A224AL80_9FLAO|nr:PASTA domain-containing protein [Blattabacterium cuenoti]BBA17420.1 hypothetical protein STAT_513 [Blattabacterium cuenoti STAT]
MNYSKYFLIFIINFLISIFILVKITQLALKWIDVYTKHGSYVVVPNLIGITLPKSISILKKLGLKYNVNTSRYDPNFKINQIISFSPEYGNHVKEGRYIYIQVNSKSSQSVLPNIINKDKRIAIKLLHVNHIYVKEIRYINNSRKDVVLKVLYQNKSIKFGYRFPFNQDGIILIIGKGYEKNNFFIPNVIGMSLSSAIYTLKNQLFHVINFYYDHDTINPDKNAKVYRQKPDPGVFYDKNKPIELWITSKKEVLDHFIEIKEKEEKIKEKEEKIKEKEEKIKEKEEKIKEKEEKIKEKKEKIKEKEEKIKEKKEKIKEKKEKIKEKKEKIKEKKEKSELNSIK